MKREDDLAEACQVDNHGHNHCYHCEWVDTEIEERKRLRDKWDKVLWAVIATLSGGAVLSFFGLLAWAFKTFIERGGH